MPLSRREFLQVGLAGATGLALLRYCRLAAAGTAAKPEPSVQWLTARQVEVFGALWPAILADAVTLDAEARAVAGQEIIESIDRALAGLTPAVQQEVQDLLGLLTFGLTKRFVAGISGDWRDASDVDVKAFLERWRNSRFETLQQAYQALVRLTIACWYANPRAWQAIAYPGPPHAAELGAL